MTDKNWLSTAGVVASFALIAGATLLQGKTRSRAEFSAKRHGLARRLHDRAHQLADAYASDAYEAMLEYRAVKDDVENFDRLPDPYRTPLEREGINKTMLNDALLDRARAFQELDRAAALAHRFDEFAEYEHKMSLSPRSVRYPEDYEFPVGFEAYYATASADPEEGRAEAELGKRLRYGKRLPAVEDARKVRASGRPEVNRGKVFARAQRFDESDVAKAVRFSKKNVRAADIESEVYDRLKNFNLQSAIPSEHPSSVSRRNAGLDPDERSPYFDDPPIKGRYESRWADLRARRERALGIKNSESVAKGLFAKYGQGQYQAVPEMTREEDEQYVQWLGALANKLERKQLHAENEKRLKVQHARYQAAMRSIGGERARPEDVETVLRDPRFISSYEAANAPLQEVNSWPPHSPRGEKRDKELAERRREVGDDPTYQKDWAVPPGPEDLLPRSFPSNLRRKQIPLTMIVMSRSEGGLVPKTNRVRAMGARVNSGLFDKFYDKVKKG